MDGASVLFHEDKIRFINRAFESIFIKSQKKLITMFDRDSQANYTSNKSSDVFIQDAKIFLMHKYVG